MLALFAQGNLSRYNCKKKCIGSVCSQTFRSADSWLLGYQHIENERTMHKSLGDRYVQLSYEQMNVTLKYYLLVTN